MARPPHPTRSVEAALRRGFIAGRLLPDTELPIIGLAEAFALSPTPIREALARLGGEGLVVNATGGGYACAPLDPSLLASLRRIEHLLMREALDRRSRPLQDLAQRLPAQQAQAGSLADLTFWLFGQIVDAAADPVLSALFSAVSARVGCVRRVEGERGEAELTQIAQALADRVDAAPTLQAYFAQRDGQEGATCDRIFEAAQSHLAEVIHEAQR